GSLREVSWERALEVAAGLGRHKHRVGALVGGQATNEEGFLLQRLTREALHSADIDSRLGSARSLDLARALAAPSLQATVVDLEYAHTVLVVGCEPLDDAPIIDLRIRKGTRRRGVQLAVATARPSALDVTAQTVVRFPPGEDAAFLSELAEDLAGDARGELAQLLREGGEDVVIVWGTRVSAAALPALLRIAEVLGLAEREGAGLLELPVGANGRGLSEVGALPNSGPGYREPMSDGRSAAEIAEAATVGELTALYLFQIDPVRDLPGQALWEQALHRAGLVVAHAAVLTKGIEEHASVVFPAESHAEKEGTVTHPDGRVQRLRAAIAHPGEVRGGWSIIAELAKRAGYDLGVMTSSMAFGQLTRSVPFYRGMTLEELGGRGVRWQDRAEAERFPAAAELATAARAPEPEQERAQQDGGFRLGTYRPIWASPEVEISPALKFAIPEQRMEISPQDAQRLQIIDEQPVTVSQNGTRLHARAHVRTGVPAGSVFLAEGIATDSANELTDDVVEVSAR
ncbi:MAG: molybdopterin-dependent oxidoreductase, partial [Solirubrobacterales bacterium]|nr:molybdopterin-dependent oxidoreductase [Solirubrobacterales bacterium]